VNSLNPTDVRTIMGVDSVVKARRDALEARLKEMVQAVAEARAFYESRVERGAWSGQGYVSSSDQGKAQTLMGPTTGPTKRKWTSDGKNGEDSER